MNIDFLFPQFVYTNLLNNIDCKKLEDDCFLLKEKLKTREVSNFGGWQSEDVEIKTFNQQNLIDNIVDNIKILFQMIEIPNLEPFVTTIWININKKNDYNLSHTHSGSFISGVFYVKVPKNSGKIVFNDHNSKIREAYLKYWHLKANIDYPLTEIFSPSWGYEPEEKLLVLFPSWLEHAVQSNKNDSNDDERISIAFNTGVKNNGT